MSPDRKTIVFPLVATIFGGAAIVTYSARFAWVKLASGRVVRLSRSRLKDPSEWSAFYLADEADKAEVLS